MKDQYGEKVPDDLATLPLIIRSTEKEPHYVQEESVFARPLDKIPTCLSKKEIKRIFYLPWYQIDNILFASRHELDYQIPSFLKIPQKWDDLDILLNRWQSVQIELNRSPYEVGIDVSKHKVYRVLDCNKRTRYLYNKEFCCA